MRKKQKPPAEEGDIVLVKWRDSSSFNKWTDKAAAYAVAASGSLACETVGWLLRRTRESLTVYQSVTRDQDEPDVDHRMQIPAGCVDRVIVLRRGR